MMTPPRDLKILVACSQKSGSTFIAKVLSLYFDISDGNKFIEYWGEREQNLYHWHFQSLLPPSFVLQMHIKPYEPHLELIRRHGVRVVYQWRNLADALISLDDHICREDWRIPCCHIDNREDYLNCPVQKRYRYIIQFAAPWFISFHQLWKKEASICIARCHYEDMVRDTETFFAQILSQFESEPDLGRLRCVLSRSSDGTRFNVGVNGRSAKLLSDENKALIERMIIEHPQDLSELLRELPWWPLRFGWTAEAQAYDGRLVKLLGRGTEEDRVYFVCNGKRRWISSPVWLEQNGRSWDELCIIGQQELEEIPLGPPIRPNPE